MTHCSEALNDTPSGEKGVCNAAVSWDDPTGSTIRDQSRIQTLRGSPCNPSPAGCTFRLLLCYNGNLNLTNKTSQYNGRGYLCAGSSIQSRTMNLLTLSPLNLTLVFLLLLPGSVSARQASPVIYFYRLYTEEKKNSVYWLLLCL